MIEKSPIESFVAPEAKEALRKAVNLWGLGLCGRTGLAGQLMASK